MKTYLTTICLFITLCSFSQTHFLKGYFVKNNGEKVDCLIENKDWKNNPTSFNYKLTESSNVETADISQINEFAIASISKFIKQKVDIDISSNNVGNLSYLKEPEWETRTVLLKVLQEGEASLYFYTAPGLNRYFYNVDGGKIIQLVYKRYNIRNQKIAKNSTYKQQLYNSFLSCSSLKMQDFNTIDYNAVSLSKIIIAYNNCKNSETVSFKQSNKSIKFNLKVKGGINSTTVNKLEHAYVASKEATFGTKLGYRFALEGEVVLPFNNNKWGIFFELAKVQKTTMESENSSGYVKFSYDYFELPLGIRHYFFLNVMSQKYQSI